MEVVLFCLVLNSYFTIIFLSYNQCINGLCLLNLHHCMDEKQKKKDEENVGGKGKGKKKETNN